MLKYLTAFPFLWILFADQSALAVRKGEKKTNTVVLVQRSFDAEKVYNACLNEMVGEPTPSEPGRTPNYHCKIKLTGTGEFVMGLPPVFNDAMRNDSCKNSVWYYAQVDSFQNLLKVDIDSSVASSDKAECLRKAIDPAFSIFWDLLYNQSFYILSPIKNDPNVPNIYKGE